MNDLTKGREVDWDWEKLGPHGPDDFVDDDHDGNVDVVGGDG